MAIKEGLIRAKHFTKQTIIKFQQMDSIQILNEDERIFSCWGSVLLKDSDGEMIPMDEFKKTLPVMAKRGGVLMDFHTNRHIGKTLNYEFLPKDGVEGILITSQVFKDYPIDDEVWGKIKSGEYRGLSLGGAYVERIYDEEKDAYVLHKVYGLEWSVVKDPANPEATMHQVNLLAKQKNFAKGPKCMNLLMERGLAEDEAYSICYADDIDKQKQKVLGEYNKTKEEEMFGKPCEEEEIQKSANKYNKFLADHGDTAKGVGWKSRDNQKARFRLTKGLLKEGSLLDVGAGTGHFFNYMKSLGWNNSYKGIDILGDYTKIAKDKGIYIQKADILDYKGSQEDNVVALGTFHVSKEETATPNEYIQSRVKKMIELAKKQVIFTLLTKAPSSIYYSFDKGFVKEMLKDQKSYKILTKENNQNIQEGEMVVIVTKSENYLSNKDLNKDIINKFEVILKMANNSKQKKIAKQEEEQAPVAPVPEDTQVSQGEIVQAIVALNEKVDVILERLGSTPEAPTEKAGEEEEPEEETEKGTGPEKAPDSDVPQDKEDSPPKTDSATIIKDVASIKKQLKDIAKGFTKSVVPRPDLGQTNAQMAKTKGKDGKTVNPLEIAQGKQKISMVALTRKIKKDNTMNYERAIKHKLGYI